MCDVVFITPNVSGSIKGESLGTLGLSTILKQKGVSCEILQFYRIGDINAFDTFLENGIQAIGQYQPKIVSFYARCDTYHIILRLAQRIKETYSDIYIVLGGPQADICAHDTLSRIPWVDFICCGEGENTVYPFFSSLLQKDPDLTVDGLVYRKDGEIIHNPRPALIEDLDTLPFPDYSQLPFTEKDTHKVFSIDAGRGCPFACTFCSTKTFWGRKYRLKSPQRIYEEIKYLHDQFGLDHFNLSHDMFTFNKKKVIETCRLFRTLDFPIVWGCSARLDCIDENLIDIMTDSGLEGIYIGIETGSPRMQKLINKNLKLDRAVEIIRYLKDKKVRTTTSFIYGFPEETEEDVSQTISLIGKLMNLKSVIVQTHLCAFLVGTELSYRYSEEMTPTEQYSDNTGEFAIEECMDLISAHPTLFRHMMEYKTELRSKLRYFTEFFMVWKYLQPVYQYISTKYPENRLIDMYYDFVEANKDLLERLEEAPNLQVGQWLGLQDRLYTRFAQDENYDLIQDFYRLRKIESTDDDQSEILCFDPRQANEVPLEEYQRCIAIYHKANRKVKTTIYPLV